MSVEVKLACLCVLFVLAAWSERYSWQERCDSRWCTSAGVDHLGWSGYSGVVLIAIQMHLNF